MDSISNILKNTPEWEESAKLIGSDHFDDLPEKISQEYAMSFLTQAG